uniref:DUF4331 domain-containing protein n=1 Tax=Steinernema glaseri TaxID=37863 RepID=A0A1I7Y3M3_9BILA
MEVRRSFNLNPDTQVITVTIEYAHDDGSTSEVRIMCNPWADAEEVPMTVIINFFPSPSNRQPSGSGKTPGP